MTDEEVYDKYINSWDAGMSWICYLKTIPTIDLIRVTKVDRADLYSNAIELKTRPDIPDNLKLEVLLLIGGES